LYEKFLIHTDIIHTGLRTCKQCSVSTNSVCLPTMIYSFQDTIFTCQNSSSGTNH